MKPFLVDKSRMIQLGLLLPLSAILFFIFNDWYMISLFVFGFIWNWTASQDLQSLLENPRYRFSMVRFVGNVQAMILRPVLKFPRFLHFIVKILPAGIFWGMVILINDSDMPWWMTFAGSLAFEIIQFEMTLFRKQKESAP